jgi:hypothetical protein
VTPWHCRIRAALRESIDLDWSCEHGIVLSAVTVGGCLAISYF